MIFTEAPDLLNYYVQCVCEIAERGFSEFGFPLVSKRKFPERTPCLACFKEISPSFSNYSKVLNVKKEEETVVVVAVIDAGLKSHYW